MSHEDNGQIELLRQLLSEEPFGQTVSEEEQGSEQGRESKPSIELSQALRVSAQLHSSPTIETRPDPGREQRKGAPEVVFGATKEATQIISMARGLLEGTGRAIISRIAPATREVVQAAFREYDVRIREAAQIMVIYGPKYARKSTGGHVGVISAGTSDIPVAEEATVLAEEMGCRVTSIYDVGVAGLHRLMVPLRDLLADEVDVIIVAAGMDGALPSVVAGLVPVPVIGLPTSIGYGIGGKGLAALLSMLQTCAPGLSVVNIDNGVGAGITAGLIANRVAQAREHRSR